MERREFGGMKENRGKLIDKVLITPETGRVAMVIYYRICLLTAMWSCLFPFSSHVLKHITLLVFVFKVSQIVALFNVNFEASFITPNPFFFTSLSELGPKLLSLSSSPSSPLFTLILFFSFFCHF